MIDVLYDSMVIPDECLLGKRVYKKFFHEIPQLGVTDKKAFREDIDTITWKYTLKPSTILIQPFENKQREYLEIAFLQVDVKTMNRTSRIAEVIHRAIPYPVVIVFSFNSNCALSLAHKRFSHASKEVIIAEDFHLTDWIDISDPTVVQNEFLASLNLSEMPHTHYFALYSAMMDRIIALNCARFIGGYQLEAEGSYRNKQKELLQTCLVMEGQLTTYRVAIKNETQFNRKVELNIDLQDTQKKLKKLITGYLEDSPNGEIES